MPPCLTIAFRWLAAEVKAGLNNIHDIASESHSLFTTYVTYCLQSRMKLNEQQQQQTEIKTGGLLKEGSAVLQILYSRVKESDLFFF